MIRVQRLLSLLSLMMALTIEHAVASHSVQDMASEPDVAQCPNDESSCNFDDSQAINQSNAITRVTNFIVGCFDSVASMYTTQLDEFPLRTKSITSSLVGGFGDLLAQIFERRYRTRSSCLEFDRTFTVAVEGLLVSGPLLHYAYDWMDDYLNLAYVFGDSLEAKWFSCFLQVTFDIIVMDSIFVATLMITSALLQGRYASIRREMMFEYTPAGRVSWLSSLSMTPLQFFNFAFVPLQFRVMITNLEDVAWNAAVSHMAHKSRR